VLAKRRLTLDENENDLTAWTPDSTAALFNSDRNGTWEIFKQATEQSLAESLITSEEQLSQPGMTPDGSEVLYYLDSQIRHARNSIQRFRRSYNRRNSPVGPQGRRHLDRAVCALTSGALHVQHHER
jgi:Tol biopolymer transport system component